MGGAAAGEVASRIFVEAAAEVLSRERSSEEETVGLVQKTFRTANESILDQARENPHYRGMGCTAEVAVFFQRRFVIGHVGDSRTYLFRQGELVQITKDHSLVQEQVDRGLITAAEARHHPHRHVIARAVGVDGKLDVDLVKGELLPGDCILLCSDGLTDMVDDPSIRDVLARPLDLSQKVEALIGLARAAGGHDNITAVLCTLAGSS
jgi:protein phosphatase